MTLMILDCQEEDHLVKDPTACLDCPVEEDFPIGDQDIHDDCPDHLEGFGKVDNKTWKDISEVAHIWTISLAQNKVAAIPCFLDMS